MSQPKKKKRTPRYSEAKKAEVLSRKVQGESERSIALNLGMSRNTVAKIGDDREFRNIVRGYRREAAKLIAPALKVLEKTLDQTDGPEEVEDREFSKIEVLDGKALAKMIRRVRKDAWRQGFKAGSDGLKAALGTLGGTSVFTSRQQIEVETQDPLEAMCLEELEANLQALYARKSQLQEIDRRKVETRP